MQPELIFERWSKPVMGELGTIRTIPENYYVASVHDDQITFEGIEVATMNIDQNYVCRWAKEHIFNGQ